MTQPIPTLEDFNATVDRGLAKLLGIKLTELTPERVVATMPVDERTRQPYGLLHGGASAALAETVASIGALMNVDRDSEAAVGIELNANHLRAKTDGTVTATATPLHRGRTTQVWEIRIEDETAQLVCVSRCTLAVVSRRARPSDSE
ncbi:MAG: hotdog fold thioesterase [Gemmatimonadota bacterium]|nr:hotdog fold thioesterase [Gemmatimonadota bacterium]